MKTNNGKLLAAVVAMLMIVCAVAVVAVPTDAANNSAMSVVAPTEGDTTVTTWDDAVKTLSTAEGKVFLDVSNQKEIIIDEDYTIPANKTLVIGKAYSPNGWADEQPYAAEFQLTVAEGVTLTVAGNLYNNIGRTVASAGLNIEGSLVVTGAGVVASTGALSFEDGSSVTGFFTNSNGKTGTAYKHMYAADITKLTTYVDNVAYSDTNGVADKRIYAYGDLAITQSVNSDTITLVVGGVSGDESNVSVTSSSACGSSLSELSGLSLSLRPMQYR